MIVENVPLEIAGVQVGTANIEDDGTIHLTMNSPSFFGQEIGEQIKQGYVRGLTLVRVVTPGVHHSLFPSERSVTIKGATGVQFGDGNSQNNQF